MAKLEKDGKTITTSQPREVVRLRASGWREVRGGGKPAAPKAADPKKD